MNMGIHSEFIWNSILSALQYFPVTLKLVFISLFVGLIIGSVIGYIRYQRVPILRQILAFFVNVYLGVPIIVALLIYHLIFLNHMGRVLQTFHISYDVSQINTIWIGVFALSLMAICNISEVIRGALHALDKGQTEAGYSVGLTKIQIIKDIIIPQLLPIIIPPLTNNVIGLIKASSLVSLIGIIDITGGAIIPAAETYAFFESYLAAACVYWGFSIMVEFILAQFMIRAGRFRRTI